MTFKKFIHLLTEEVKTVRNFVNRRAYINSGVEKSLIDQFHRFYHDSAMWGMIGTSWLGVKLKKCPLDLWVYQEIIFEVKPDVIIEAGTQYGGSALFLASVCDLVNKGKVITIDIENQGQPEHERIKYLLGSSTSDGIIRQVKELINPGDKVMVILDSDHSRDHVFNEMNIYSQFVTKDSYLIVEDTNINGHPVSPGVGPGPMEAVNDFLPRNNFFVVDKSKEKFHLTFNPKGYLRRIK